MICVGLIPMASLPKNPKPKIVPVAPADMPRSDVKRDFSSLHHASDCDTSQETPETRLSVKFSRIVQHTLPHPGLKGLVLLEVFSELFYPKMFFKPSEIDRE